MHLFLDANANLIDNLTDEDYSFEMLGRHGVTAVRIAMSGVSTLKLGSLFGLRRPSQLAALGFDAIFLATHECSAVDLLRIFDREELVMQVLASPDDAVSLAGSSAASILGISTGTLLASCDGSAQHAEAVLQEQASRNLDSVLRGVSLQHVLECGLSGEKLRKYGLTTVAMIGLGADDRHLRHLGLAPKI